MCWVYSERFLWLHTDSVSVCLKWNRWNQITFLRMAGSKANRSSLAQTRHGCSVYVCDDFRSDERGHPHAVSWLEHWVMCRSWYCSHYCFRNNLWFLFDFFLKGDFFVRQSCVEIQLISWCVYHGNKLLPHFSGWPIYWPMFGLF